MNMKIQLQRPEFSTWKKEPKPSEIKFPEPTHWKVTNWTSNTSLQNNSFLETHSVQTSTFNMKWYEMLQGCKQQLKDKKNSSYHQKNEIYKILKQLTAPDGTCAIEMYLPSALRTSSFPMHSASINLLENLLVLCIAAERM